MFLRTDPRVSIHQCSRSMISLGDLFMSKISRIEYWKFFSMYPAPRFLSCLFPPEWSPDAYSFQRYSRPCEAPFRE